MLVLPACQSAPPPAEQPPAWIEEPADGAVGSAGTHVRGRHYQEELAITRARERLAARYGVTLSSVSTITEKVKNDALYVSSDHEIRQAVTAREVKAQVRAVWYDRATDTVWVWLYPVGP
jgi:hypothetical protein